MSIAGSYENLWNDDTITGSVSSMGVQGSVDTYTITSGTTYNWSSTSPVSITDGNTAARLENSGKLYLQGENADILINGASVGDLLKRMEQRLNLLSVNPALEQEWDELRELGNRYRELEQEILAKQEMWDKLKSPDRSNR